MKYALIIIILNGFNSSVNQHMVTIPVADLAHCQQARDKLDRADWPKFYTECIEVQ